MGSGKNYHGRRLSTVVFVDLKCIELAFALALKGMIAGKGVDSSELLSSEKTAETRQLLTSTGQSFRHENGLDYFAKVLTLYIQFLHKDQGFVHFVITDLRLKVELEYFQQMAKEGRITLVTHRVNAPIRNRARLMKEARGDTALADKLAADISEVDLDSYTGWDHIIENDTNEEVT